MKRILITGAGGSPATNFIRSLRRSGEEFYIIGVDSNEYYLQRAETDERYLAPRCDEPDYLTVINEIILKTGAEFLYSQPDVEISFLSENRDRVACRMYLPSNESVQICQDKYSSYLKWADAGLRVPGTMLIKDEDDLRDCFKVNGPRIWIRECTGAFGKGSLPTSDFEQARAWVNFHKGWGRFCGAECLEPDSVTWQSIWWEGELVIAQSRRRLYWEFANRAPSGVTGLTGAGVTISDPRFDELAIQAILAIDTKPHGIWSVDMTLDRDGVPNPTEINIGRFFTTHLFFTEAGLNMPYIFVKLAYGEYPDPFQKRINPLPVDLVWIRGMDIEPILTTMNEISRRRTELQILRERV